MCKSLAITENPEISDSKKHVMKKNNSVIPIIILVLCSCLCLTIRSAAQTTLFTEDFESASIGQIPPAGWGIDLVNGSNYLYFKSTGINPACVPPSGSRMVEFNSFDAPSGTDNRLKMNTPISTVGYNTIMVDFKWYVDPGLAMFNDQVNVQFSTNGTTWTTAGTVMRVGLTPAWSTQTVSLPASASGQATLYVAFDFVSVYGNSCHLDLVHILAGGPLPPATVTVGTGSMACTYPYSTLWMGGRTQLLYSAADMLAAGATPGMISSIGFNVTTASSQTMQNFNIRMMNSSLNAFTGWVTGLQNCYSGSYAVPGTGWQMITLQTPFYWDGSNVILEICYGNNGSYTGNTTVSGVTATVGQVQTYWQDNTVGCSFTGAALGGYANLPNLRFVEQPYSGALMGTITNCFNNHKMSGVTVTCGSHTTTTNNVGGYIFYNLPVGYSSITCSVSGYNNSLFAETITNGQSVNHDLCMNAIPGYLTGFVMSATTGNPIIGATVSINGQTTKTTGPGGNYSITIYEFGSFSATISKTGFDDFVTIPISLTSANTNVQVFGMAETANSPYQPTATLNAGQSAANITWGSPQGYYELLYDDGIREALWQWPLGGNYNAVKYTPASYPCMITGGNINIGEQSDYPAGSYPLSPMQILIFDASGPGGTPGVQIGGPFDFTPYTFGWNNFNFYPYIAISSGSFYLVQKQGEDAPNAAGVALDNTTNQLGSYMKTMPSGTWTQAAGNFMMRAIVFGPGGPVPLMASHPRTGNTGAGSDAPENTEGVTGYQVWRLILGQEYDPATWVSLGTTPSLSQVDNSWPALPCNPYRWAVKAQYTGNRWSDASFSNGIGKCWAVSVTMNVSLSCGSSTLAGTYVKLQNTAYPDSIYQAVLGPSGTVTFPAVFKGTYAIQVEKYGFIAFVQSSVSITSNVSTNVVLQQNLIPPSNLVVDNHTLNATWNPPDNSTCIFNEDWSSGVFWTNGWTTSGGNHWTITPFLGDPAPAATFKSFPAITGYDEYLTSTSIAAVHSPMLKIRYDIFLNSNSAPGTNFMKIEIWNGTTWVVLKSYSNTSSIPWTTDSVDISGYTHNTFNIRFHASGGNITSINNWKIDNIKVIANDPALSSCMSGYNFYLNGTLQAVTMAPSFPIPSDYAAYGQSVTACVNAAYGSGNSIEVCQPFVAKFLCSPINLGVADDGSTASLTWTKPSCAPGSQNCFIYDDGSMENGWSFNPGYTLWLGNIMNSGSSQSGQLTSFEMRWWDYTAATAQPFKVDIFNMAGALLGSSQTFVVPVPAPSGYMEVVLSTPISFTGPFYCMLKWNNFTGSTHWLGYDQSGPNVNAGLAYAYDGTTFIPWTTYAGGAPGVFCLRACGTSLTDGSVIGMGPKAPPAGNLVPIDHGMAISAPPGSITPEPHPPVNGNSSKGGSDSPLSDPLLIGYNVYMAPDSIGPYSKVQYIEGADLLTDAVAGLSPGIHWFRVTAFYDLGPIGLPGTYDESAPTEPKAAYIGVVPFNLYVSDLVVNSGQSYCYDAMNTMTIAGSGKYFTVSNGGSASMVAGLKISYLYGTKVLPGGYMHGSITTTNQFCSPGKSPAGNTLTGEEQLAEGTVESTLFKVWPNPTHGDVTIEISKTCQSCNSSLEIYGPLGERILTRSMNGEKKTEISLQGHASGIYFIRLSKGKESATAKIILQ